MRRQKIDFYTFAFIRPTDFSVSTGVNLENYPVVKYR